MGRMPAASGRWVVIQRRDALVGTACDLQDLRPLGPPSVLRGAWRLNYR